MGPTEGPVAPGTALAYVPSAAMVVRRDGFVGFDESLRVELARSAPGVRTTVVCPYYVDTGMFAGVRTRVPWLLPILRPEPVARRIVDAVERDRPMLVMPPIVRLLPALRVLPPRAFDRVMDLFGVNRSMDEFRGHGG